MPYASRYVAPLLTCSLASGVVVPTPTFPFTSVTIAELPDCDLLTCSAAPGGVTNSIRDSAPEPTTVTSSHRQPAVPGVHPPNTLAETGPNFVLTMPPWGDSGPTA